MGINITTMMSIDISHWDSYLIYNYIYKFHIVGINQRYAGTGKQTIS